MSKRRGRYVTFDEVIDESIKRAFTEVEKRSPGLSLDTKKRISEAVGVGAVKYALIDVAPSKQVTFIWDNVLSFEKNSAPFIQYAYARACNIVDKVDLKTIAPDYSLLKETIELELVGRVARFPETLIAAANSLLPSLLAEFSYGLAARFNSFYASLPVLKAEPIGLRDARLSLVEGVRIALKNALDLLGIEALEKM
jgi:arginyl-tRNA synthetase